MKSPCGLNIPFPYRPELFEELSITKGLKDWKKLSDKLSKHAGSQFHISHMGHSNPDNKVSIWAFTDI